jgi:hypothetical protein
MSIECERSKLTVSEKVRLWCHIGRSETIRLAPQVVLRPPQADRKIFLDQEEISRFTRDEALHWIATALCVSQWR